MATRLYLTNAAPGYTPSTKRGGWDLSTASLARQLGPSPSGTATTAAGSKSTATTNWDVLLGRWISDPMDRAGDLSGTVQWIIGVLESSTNANMVFHLHIFVTQGDSDNVRGTVLTDNIGGTEWANSTATGRGESTQALTTVACQVGDRVVVEVGYQSQASGTGYTGTINYGGTGNTDLASASTAVTTNPGWIEFSDPNGVLRHHMEVVRDNFNDNTVNTTLWPYTGGTFAETGGQAQLTAPANNTFSYFETLGQYTLAESSVTCYMAPPSAQDSAGFANARVALYEVTQSNTYMAMYVNSVTGTLGWFATVNNVDAFDESFTPTGGFVAILSGGWYRIAESGGTLAFYASLDGVSWGAPVSTQATPAAFRASSRLTVDLEAIRATSTSAGSPAVFDNLNLPPAVAAASQTTTAGGASAAAPVITASHTTIAGGSATASSGNVASQNIVAAGTATAAANSPASASQTTTAGSTASGAGGYASYATTGVAGSAVAAANSPAAAARTVTAAGSAAAAANSPAVASRTVTAAGTGTARANSPATTARTITVSGTATAVAPGVVTGYRAVVPVQALAETGVSLRWSPVDVFNGNRFANSGRAIVHLRNRGLSTVTATFRYRHPQAPADGRQIVLAPGARVTTAVWPRLDYTQTDGACWVDFTSGTSVEMAVAEVYPAW